MTGSAFEVFAKRRIAHAQRNPSKNTEYPIYGKHASSSSIFSDEIKSRRRRIPFSDIVVNSANSDQVNCAACP